MSVNTGLFLKLSDNVPPAKQAFVASPAQYLTFVGSLASSPSVTRTFSALCGPNPPTITGGWAKWNTIDRPQQVGMTVIAGYDPLSMDVQVRFEAVTGNYRDSLYGTTNQSAQGVETDIQTLEWMAGPGRKNGQPIVGDSPLVRVYSADSSGDERPLVPPTAQGLRYVVTNLSYDTSPLRNTRGYRMRQDATVSLLEYVQDQFAAGADSSSARAKAVAGVAGQYKVVTLTAGMNTVQKVANQVAHDPGAAPVILLANKNVQGIGTSVHKKLPSGTRLRVPVANIKGL